MGQLGPVCYALVLKMIRQSAEGPQFRFLPDVEV